jgi:hypothetical protein
MRTRGRKDRGRADWPVFLSMRFAVMAAMPRKFCLWMPLFQPVDGIRRAPMPRIGCFVNSAGFGQFRVFKKALHIIVQLALIAFKRQNVIGFLRHEELSLNLGDGRGQAAAA